MTDRRPARARADRRRVPLLLAVLAAAAALAAATAGCSKGEPTAATSSSTTSTAAPGPTTTFTTTPPPTLDDGAYTKFVTTIRTKLGAAGTDPCRVAQVFRDIGQGPQPQNVAQGRQAVDLVVELFDSVAAAAGPAGAADATALRAGGARVAAAAKANGYRPDWIAKNANETVGAEGITALQRLVTANEKRCRDRGGASPGTP